MDWFLLILLWGIYACNQNNTIISSFYPQYAEHHFGLEELIVGFIFSAHSVGVFASSLILAKIMHRKGMKKINMIIGMIIQVLVNVLFILLKYIDNQTMFITISVIARFILGVGQGLFCTPSYSYLPILYGDRLEKIIGYIEAMAGLGLSLGPLIGGFFYDLLGFESTFVFNAVISVIIIPLQFKYVPYTLNYEDVKAQKLLDSNNLKEQKLKDQDFKELQKSKEKLQEYVFTGLKVSEPYNENQEDVNDMAQESNYSEGATLNEGDGEVAEFQINYLYLMKFRQIIFSCILVFYPTSLVGFLDPCLAPFAQREYQLSASVVGIVFFAGAMLYILSLPVVGLITKRFKAYKKLLFTGALLSGTSMLIMAPSLGLPKSPIWMFVAQGFLNIGNSFIYIPVIPDMIETLETIYPDVPEDIIGNISSALYNSSFAFGYFIGPSLGGVLVHFLNFYQASFCFGITLISFSIIYLIFGGVITSRTKNKAVSKIHQSHTGNNNQIVSSRTVSFNVQEKKVFSRIFPEQQQTDEQIQQRMANNNQNINDFKQRLSMDSSSGRSKASTGGRYSIQKDPRIDQRPLIINDSIN